MSGASGADRRVVAPDKSSSGTVAETPPPLVLDSALTPEVPFTPLAVTMYGYAKRVSDARETFVLRNETRCYHISRVMVKIVYSTQDGKPFHTREELVECDLMPGSSRVVTLKSFDTAKTYYYYLNPPVRAAGALMTVLPAASSIRTTTSARVLPSDAATIPLRGRPQPAWMLTG